MNLGHLMVNSAVIDGCNLQEMKAAVTSDFQLLQKYSLSVLTLKNYIPVI